MFQVTSQLSPHSSTFFISAKIVLNETKKKKKSGKTLILDRGSKCVSLFHLIVSKFGFGKFICRGTTVNVDFLLVATRVQQKLVLECNRKKIHVYI